MSFNTAINAGSLLDTLNESSQTKEDRYICDRAAYMAGRRGEKVEYSTKRETDMNKMGLSAHKEFG